MSVMLASTRAKNVKTNQEIERKYLLPAAPVWLGECRCERIEQGYLALEANVEVRLRRIGKRRLLTVKRGTGREREEREAQIPQEAFEELWPLTEGRRVSKLRHYRETEAGCFEVDVYAGKLEGLITAEIEFASAPEAERFPPPEWLGRELTDEPGWANRDLALAGRPDEAER